MLHTSHWDARGNSGQRFELSPAHCVVQQVACISICNQLDQTGASRGAFDQGCCRICATLAQNVNGSEGKRRALKLVTAVREIQIAFIPRRRQARERMWRAVQGIDRFRPQTNSRISWLDEERAAVFIESDYIFRQYPITQVGKSSGGGRFP